VEREGERSPLKFFFFFLGQMAIHTKKWVENSFDYNFQMGFSVPPSDFPLCQGKLF